MRDRTLAIGAGQMSRVDAVKVAVMKARAGRGTPPLAGSVAASDAFFPFRDGLDAVAAAGATAVVQPGGSVRDAEVIAAADEHGLAMVFTGRRHFAIRTKLIGPDAVTGPSGAVLSDNGNLWPLTGPVRLPLAPTSPRRAGGGLAEMTRGLAVDPAEGIYANGRDRFDVC